MKFYTYLLPFYSLLFDICTAEERIIETKPDSTYLHAIKEIIRSWELLVMEEKGELESLQLLRDEKQFWEEIYNDFLAFSEREGKVTEAMYEFYPTGKPLDEDLLRTLVQFKLSQEKNHEKIQQKVHSRDQMSANYLQFVINSGSSKLCDEIRNYADQLSKLGISLALSNTKDMDESNLPPNYKVEIHEVLVRIKDAIEDFDEIQDIVGRHGPLLKNYGWAVNRACRKEQSTAERYLSKEVKEANLRARKMAKKVKQDMAEFDGKFKGYFEKHGDDNLKLSKDPSPKEALNSVTECWRIMFIDNTHVSAETVSKMMRQRQESYEKIHKDLHNILDSLEKVVSVFQNYFGTKGHRKVDTETMIFLSEYRQARFGSGETIRVDTDIIPALFYAKENLSSTFAQLQETSLSEFRKLNKLEEEIISALRKADGIRSLYRKFSRGTVQNMDVLLRHGINLQDEERGDKGSPLLGDVKEKMYQTLKDLQLWFDDEKKVEDILSKNRYLLSHFVRLSTEELLRIETSWDRYWKSEEKNMKLDIKGKITILNKDIAEKLHRFDADLKLSVEKKEEAWETKEEANSIKFKTEL